MKLAGFVIHGNNARTLGACLADLCAVCDEVVAVDSDSTDGSAELVRRHGVRALNVPWQGYGAARAAAVEALGDRFDYCFFLDADERLGDGSREVLHRWKQSRPDAAAYFVRLRDWATPRDGGERFVYRAHRRNRLLRRDVARWSPRMIVHEAMPVRARQPLGVVIEHEFAIDWSFRAEKDYRYALLWAIQSHAERRRPKPRALQRIAHLGRDLVVKGALWRGGTDAVELAWVVSRQHALKYELLREVQRGEHAELVRAYEEGRLGELFERVRRAAT